LRIGIDTLVAVPGEIGGTQTYLQKLIENLAKIDKENEYFLFVAPWNKELFRVEQKNFRKVVCRIPAKPLFLRVLYEQIILPFKVWRNKIDVFHFPASVSSLFLSCPSILTLHDITPLVSAKLIPPIPRYYWKFAYKFSTKRADFIITISHSVKKDIAKFLAVPGEKIKVIYQGIKVRIPEIKNKTAFDLHQDEKDSFSYILWVGKMYTHKNLPRLLRAYSKLIKTWSIKHQLVLCGLKGWGYSSFIKTVEELNLQDKVIFKGYVPDNELELMYLNSSLFVFPSLSEGFGLPILEAMSYGVPVITSNYGAMAEVADDAALLVDPYNIDEIAKAMYKVLTDKNLRENLIKKGLERAKQFSWKKTAKETLKVYKKAYIC